MTSEWLCFLVQLPPRAQSRAGATKEQRANTADLSSRSIRGPRSTTRKAWVEVRDYTSLEIQTRRAMVEALREVVIPELVQLKVSLGCRGRRYEAKSRIHCCSR